jgi:hypothetical protein
LGFGWEEGGKELGWERPKARKSSFFQKSFSNFYFPKSFAILQKYFVDPKLFMKT